MENDTTLNVTFMLPLASETKIIALVLLVLGIGLVGFTLRTIIMAPSVISDAKEQERYRTMNVMESENQRVVENNTSVGTTKRSGSDEVMVVRDLSGQGLTEVPRAEFERPDTEVFDLSKNELVSVPSEIRQLSQLKILNLSNNKLTGLPAELGQLTELESLELANNKLTGLPYELGNLKHLQLLDLRGNDYSLADLQVIKRGLSNTIILTDK